MDAGEPALDHLAGVEQQVPAVGDLHGLGRAQRGAARIFGRAVACHEPDLRLAAEPGGPGLGRAVGQQIDGTTTFEIDHDGPVGSTLAQRPVVDADDMRPLDRRQRHPPDRTQQRRGTDRHGQVREQPGGRLTAERETGLSLGLDEPPGALGVAGEQMREALGEGVAGAGRVAAVEAPDRQLQPDPLPLTGRSAGRR